VIPATQTLATPLTADRMEPAPAPSPLHALTSGLARGDDAAWAEFHRDFGPGIFRHLLGATCGDHDLANEALQQTYLRIARHARPCDSAPMFSAWLRVVARSALNDCLRRRRSFWQLLSHRHADPLNDSSSKGDEEEVLAALDSALAQLDEANRGLLEAKYLLGASIRSLAAQLSLSEKAVESRLTRARAELRRQLLATLARHE
jgi:RNA polymerase sigma factor (sigma-70 family)